MLKVWYLTKHKVDNSSLIYVFNPLLRARRNMCFLTSCVYIWALYYRLTLVRECALLCMVPLSLSNPRAIGRQGATLQSRSCGSDSSSMAFGVLASFQGIPFIAFPQATTVRNTSVPPHTMRTRPVRTDGLSGSCGRQDGAQINRTDCGADDTCPVYTEERCFR